MFVVGNLDLSFIVCVCAPCVCACACTCVCVCVQAVAASLLAYHLTNLHDIK